MCVPHPSGAAPASIIPSVQTATSLELGGAGAPRGAAQLGRLALRFGGTDAASSSISPATSQAAAAQTGGNSPASAAPILNPAAAAQSPGVGTAVGSLAGLRFGNFNTQYN